MRRLLLILILLFALACGRTAAPTLRATPLPSLPSSLPEIAPLDLQLVVGNAAAEQADYNPAIRSAAGKILQGESAELFSSRIAARKRVFAWTFEPSDSMRAANRFLDALPERPTSAGRIGALARNLGSDLVRQALLAHVEEMTSAFERQLFSTVPLQRRARFGSLKITDTSESVAVASGLLPAEFVNSPEYAALSSHDRYLLLLALQAATKQSMKFASRPPSMTSSSTEQQPAVGVSELLKQLRALDSYDTSALAFHDQLERYRQLAASTIARESASIQVRSGAFDNASDAEKQKIAEENQNSLTLIRTLASDPFLPTSLSAESKWFGSLEPPWWREMPDPKKADILDAQADLKQARSATLERFNGVVKGARGIVGLLQQSGQPADEPARIVEAAAQVASAGEQMFGLVDKIVASGGSPIAAFSAFASLVGGGGPFGSSTPARDGRIDQILSMQKQTLQSLARIEKSLGDLTELVKEQHKQVLAKLDETLYSVQLNRKILVELMGERFETCEDFLRSGDVPTYERRRIRVLDHAAQYERCRDAFTEIVMPRRIHAFLRLETNEDTDKLNPNDVKAMKAAFSDFNRRRRDMIELPPQNVSDRLRLASTLSPSFTAEHLHAKSSRKTLHVTDNLPDDPDVLLNPEAVLRVAHLAVQFVPYLNLQSVRQRGALMTSAELLEPGSYVALSDRNADALRILQASLQLVNSSIAQQTFYAGDLALAPLVEKVKSRESVAKWTKGNRILAKNVVMLVLRDALKDTNAHLLVYSLALAADQPRLLQTLTRVPGQADLVFERSTDGIWSVLLSGDTTVALPSVDEFARGRLVHNSHVRPLLDARRALVDSIADYEVKRFMPSREHNFVTTLSFWRDGGS